MVVDLSAVREAADQAEDLSNEMEDTDPVWVGHSVIKHLSRAVRGLADALEERDASPR